MTASLTQRLVGVCTLCMITIAVFKLKMVWWAGVTHPAAQMSIVGPTIIALLAVAAAVGTWKQKPWGYVLVILLGALENIATVHGRWLYPELVRVSDTVDFALAAVPLASGMFAAVALLLGRRRSASP